MVRNSKERGRFITVEGIEGVGKSTNLGFVANELRRAGHAVVETREPGGTGARGAHPGAAAQPGIPDRATHRTAADVCRPGRAYRRSHPAGARTAASGLSATASPMPAMLTRAAAGACLPTPSTPSRRSVQGDLRPDLTLLLDAPLAISAERQAGRGQRDRFEQESSRVLPSRPPGLPGPGGPGARANPADQCRPAARGGPGGHSAGAGESRVRDRI